MHSSRKFTLRRSLVLHSLPAPLKPETFYRVDQFVPVPGGAMAQPHTPGQPVSAVVQRVEIQKLRQEDHLILGFSIGGGIDQDPAQNPFSQNKNDKGIYVTRVSPGGPAYKAGLKEGDKIMQVNGWDMTMVTHDKARKKLTKKSEDVVRLLVTRRSLEEVVKQSMCQWRE